MVNIDREVSSHGDSLNIVLIRSLFLLSTIIKKKNYRSSRYSTLYSTILDNPVRRSKTIILKSWNRLNHGLSNKISRKSRYIYFIHIGNVCLFEERLGDTSLNHRSCSKSPPRLSGTFFQGIISTGSLTKLDSGLLVPCFTNSSKAFWKHSDPMTRNRGFAMLVGIFDLTSLSGIGDTCWKEKKITVTDCNRLWPTRERRGSRYPFLFKR